MSPTSKTEYRWIVQKEKKGGLSIFWPHFKVSTKTSQISQQSNPSHWYWQSTRSFSLLSRYNLPSSWICLSSAIAFPSQHILSQSAGLFDVILGSICSGSSWATLIQLQGGRREGRREVGIEAWTRFRQLTLYKVPVNLCFPHRVPLWTPAMHAKLVCVCTLHIYRLYI